MGYVPHTPIDSYPTMPCSVVISPNEVRRIHGCSECTMDDVILYADNKAVASYSTIAKERDIPKAKASNCPNCGAPVTGPICEYCGSVLNQAELDRQEQELAEKQRQYEEMLRRWQQSVINAELGQSMTNRMNYYSHEISQCCCDTRTQISQQSNVQSQVYIPKPVPLVIEEKQTKDFGYEDVFWAWVIIVMILVILLIAPFLA